MFYITCDVVKAKEPTYKLMVNSTNLRFLSVIDECYSINI